MNNIKSKIRIVFILLVISSLYFVGESFAKYVTTATGDVKNNNTNRIEFASFIVNNNFENQLNIDINNFYPGSSKTFTFCVWNYREVAASKFYYTDITIKYKVIIKSYALPLQFSLKKDNTTINLSCSGSPGVTCNSAEQELSYSNNVGQCYLLTVTYPEGNGGVPFYSTYSSNIDLVNLTLASWQKG